MIDDPDSGEPTTCSPQTVPDYTFQTAGQGSGLCTRAQLDELYVECVSDQNTIGGCEATKAKFKSCSSCAMGPAATAKQYPWISYDDRVTAFPNYGLCMATFRGETKATDCGIAYGQFFECLNAACVTPCADLATADAFDQCRTDAADQGVCTKGGTTALSTKCTNAYEASDPTYGFCTSGEDEKGNLLDDQEYMVRIALLTCGAASDAGTDGGK